MDENGNTDDGFEPNWMLLGQTKRSRLARIQWIDFKENPRKPWLEASSKAQMVLNWLCSQWLLVHWSFGAIGSLDYGSAGLWGHRYFSSFNRL